MPLDKLTKAEFKQFIDDLPSRGQVGIPPCATCGQEKDTLVCFNEECSMGQRALDIAKTLRREDSPMTGMARYGHHDGCEAWPVEYMEVKHGDMCLHAVNPNNRDEKYPLHILPSVPKWTGLYGYKLCDKGIGWAKWPRACTSDDFLYSPTGYDEVRIPDYVEMRDE